MIYFNDKILVAGGMMIDPDTGDKVLGDFITYPARVIREFKEIRDYNGDKTISAIKIYVSNEAKLTTKSMIQLGEETYSIINLAEKRHLDGTISHFEVYL